MPPDAQAADAGQQSHRGEPFRVGQSHGAGFRIERGERSAPVVEPMDFAVENNLPSESIRRYGRYSFCSSKADQPIGAEGQASEDDGYFRGEVSPNEFEGELQALFGIVLCRIPIEEGVCRLLDSLDPAFALDGFERKGEFFSVRFCLLKFRFLACARGAAPVVRESGRALRRCSRSAPRAPSC